MAELWKEQISVSDETWLNLLQHATQSEIDVFLALLEQNGLRIIEVEKYNRVMSLVDESIQAAEKLEACIKAQAVEIEALELRIKTLIRQ